jgi:2-polyprenyl-3-methyl-5-hydroxy-6-metoxy-1,4-benzoquinol methylase
LEADVRKANEATRQAWNRNAAFWDERMGEGNDFVEVLLWPATERLLGLRPGERVLDVACGNGLTSRRLAALRAAVVAFDFAELPIRHCSLFIDSLFIVHCSLFIDSRMQLPVRPGER